jgi:sarcosine oxidase subunit beta
MTDQQSADIVIVGAGAYGLSCAFHISELDPKAKVVVLDAGEFASGASGRNGAGFRMQWALEFNIRLSQESIRFFEDAVQRLDYPDGIDLKQDGYLMLAHSEASMAQLQKGYEMQQAWGVPSEVVSADDCVRMVPALNRDVVVGGTFCGKDGSASPFLWLDALLRASRRNGVDVRYRTRVIKVEKQGDGFIVTTDAGRIAAAKVLLCTDWAVPQLLGPMGVDLPITGLPKEILVTEACAPRIGPTIISMDNHIAVTQVGRGNIVLTVTRDRERGDDLSHTPDFLGYSARKLHGFIPGIDDVRILRSWAGVSSETPDMQAVLGESDIDGVFVAVSAYKGFMTSPAVGRVMSQLLIYGNANDPVVEPLHPRRFQTGELVPEPLTNQDLSGGVGSKKH